MYARKGKTYSRNTKKSVSARVAAKILANAGIRHMPVSYGGLGAPLATRGFYGQYTKRGREELKVIENAVSGPTQFTSAGLVVLMNGVAQGSDFTNRIGQKICMKSLLARFWISPSGNTASGDIARVMVVYDTQPNSSGSVPAVTDILTSADCFSGINLNNRDRFKVILDKKIAMYPVVYTAGAITAGAPISRYVDKYRKFNLDVIFSGTAATIGSISSGSLLWLLIDQNTTTSEYAIYSRIRFSDS